MPRSKPILAKLHTEGNTPSYASSVKDMTKRQRFQITGNTVFLQTVLIQITVLFGWIFFFFGGNFWWIKSILTPAGALRDWRQWAEAEEGIFEGTVKTSEHFTNLLAQCTDTAIDTTLPVCHNIQSQRLCNTTFRALLTKYFPEHSDLPRFVCCQMHVLFIPKRSTFMRSAYHLLPKSVQTYNTVQILLPSRWLLLIVHYFLRYVS